MTIKEIANLAGVSVATVSRVINDSPKVSEDAKEKVLNIIKQTGYVPNIVGRNLRLARTNRVLVMVPTSSNPFYSEILLGIQNRASENNYSVIVVFTNLDEELENSALDMVASKQVDGIICLSSKFNKSLINEFASKYPFVQCCEYTPYANIPYVMIDNEKAAYEATSYLIDQNHKNIGMITGEYYYSSEQSRRIGYENALKDANYEIEPNYIIGSSYTFDGGYEACKKLFSLKNPPTAIFCVSDDMAIGALKFISDIGLVVGEDISIIGFDDTSICSVFSPTISSVSQPRYDLGVCSFDLVMNKINDQNSANRSIILPHRLVLRESTEGKK